MLNLLENEYNQQQCDVSTPKVDIENLKITPGHIPLQKNVTIIPLTSRPSLRSHEQPHAVSARLRNRNETVNNMIRDEIIRRVHRNECYIMQAEGDFTNSFSSQISRADSDNLDVSGLEQDKSILREPKSQKPLISTKIDLTKRKLTLIKKGPKKRVEI